jgi:adenylate cyclase
MIFVVNFSQTMNRLLGQKAIVRLVLGLYHRPVSEKRFVMFLDLAGSTTIAEKLGDEAFHGFLRDFFRDITEPLLVKKAEIYKYVGDEVILTWKEEEGLADLNVLSVFFAIREHLRQFEDEYMRKYGTLPQFRAGLHFGKVIVGELGEYKMEVAILGDVMNTTARIEALCSEYDMNFILSRDVLDRFEGRDLAGYRLESIGSITLRGKEKDLELFGVEEV